ncbi:hypothetical protein PMAYCL1PPCAC_10929, partial [Pristionchus mayeri]
KLNDVMPVYSCPGSEQAGIVIDTLDRKCRIAALAEGITGHCMSPMRSSNCPRRRLRCPKDSWFHCRYRTPVVRIHLEQRRCQTRNDRCCPQNP